MTLRSLLLPMAPIVALTFAPHVAAKSSPSTNSQVVASPAQVLLAKRGSKGRGGDEAAEGEGKAKGHDKGKGKSKLKEKAEKAHAKKDEMRAKRDEKKGEHGKGHDDDEHHDGHGEAKDNDHGVKDHGKGMGKGKSKRKHHDKGTGRRLGKDLAGKLLKENEKHEARLAKIDRLEEIAATKKNDKLLNRVAAMREKEV